jgi:ABC-type spermidine/putrescine transport system permease subunit I
MRLKLKLAKPRVRLKGAGPIGELIGSGIAVVIFTVILAVGAYILSNLKSNIQDQTAQNIIDKGVNSIRVFGDWLGLLAFFIVALIIIGLLITVYRRLEKNTE